MLVCDTEIVSLWQEEKETLQKETQSLKAEVIFPRNFWFTYHCFPFHFVCVGGGYCEVIYAFALNMCLFLASFMTK